MFEIDRDWRQKIKEMKKKIVAAPAITVALILVGCGNTQVKTQITQEAVATTNAAEVLEIEQSTQEETSVEKVEEPSTQEELTTEVQTESQETTETETAEYVNEIAALTDGERAARKEQQANFAEVRELLYAEPNSLEKTQQINQMDRQILANNAYDFSGLNVLFIGDSITEGVTAAIDQNDNPISYTTYVNSYLHFQRLLNHGVAGRMFSEYGGSELSLDANFDNIMNNESDVIIVFAGVNDYLAGTAEKRFGDINNVNSTAGYCGAVRSFMTKMQRYYSDREVFFVTMYPMQRTANPTFTDVEGTLTLNDFMEVQRELAAEYGFHVIDLYSEGFMDCSTQEAADYYLADGIHPNDMGNIALGEHIAAELSLYFGQKEE